MTSLMIVCTDCIDCNTVDIYSQGDNIPIGARTSFATKVDGYWKSIKSPYGHVDAFLNEHKGCSGLEIK